MGNKQLRSLELDPGSRYLASQSDGDFERKGTSSTGNSRLKRTESTAAPRFSLRVRSLVLRDQRYRENVYKNTSNPRYGKPRDLRNSRTGVRRSRGMTDMPIPEQEQENSPRPKLLQSNLNIPAPPSGKPPVKPRFYTDCEDPPFSHNHDKRSIMSQSFNTLEMSEAELKDCAVTMLLSAVNEHVLFQHRVKRKNRLYKLRSFGSSGVSARKRALKPKLTMFDSEYGEQHYIPDQTVDAISNFVEEVCRRYTATKYHSFKHAVDVTQMMFMLLFFFRKALTPIQPFAMLVASLCHDVGHFGANNPFLLESKENNCFVQRFGEDSPLEKFHVYTMKKIMASCELFSQKYMEPNVYKEISSFATTLILATDMAKHDSILAKAIEDLHNERELVKNGAEEKYKEIPESFLKLSIKLCDVANVCRDYVDARQWTDLLSTEFQAMGTISILEKSSSALTSEGRSYEELLASEEFPITDAISSIALIQHQGKCKPPDFDGCSKLTIDFMENKTKPMAYLLNQIQPQAGWFLLTRMRSNLIEWNKAIKKTKTEKMESST